MIFVKSQLINRKGFTLVEALLVLALLSLLVAVTAPLYQNMQVRSNLDNQASILSQTWRRAQSLSRSGNNDSSWGVMLSTSTVTLFSGASYASRDTSYDEIFNLPESVWPASSSEIVFSKYWGLPSASTTVILYSNTNESRILSINGQGGINYE